MFLRLERVGLGIVGLGNWPGHTDSSHLELLRVAWRRRSFALYVALPGDDEGVTSPPLVLCKFSGCHAAASSRDDLGAV
eukprot:gene8075-biopygen14485